MTAAPLFGLLILDRDPFVFADFWGLVQAWLQDAGGFAAVGLAVYLLYALRTPPEQAASAKDRAGVSGLMLAAAVLAMLCYVGFAVLLWNGRGADTVNVSAQTAQPGAFVKYTPPKFSRDLQPLLLTLGGLFALVGIGEPFARSLGRVRGRRLWALARLGFKEAVRSRMVWVFLLILVPLLFPITWFLPFKPEDELRITVGVTSGWTQVLLLLSAALLAAFAIPNDVKNQNIYTVVTKPVERFEIVLGRFLGYSGLMTLALVGVTAVSWLFIRTTTLDEKAREETFKARVPLRGKLSFASRKGEIEGTNVGREFDYRKYIAGDPGSSQRAVWSFPAVPARLAGGRDHVPCEFTFDIFRMTKGEENRGVDLVVRVASWQCPQEPPREAREGTWRWADAEKERAYQEDARALVAAMPGGAGAQNPASVLALAKPGSPGWDVVNKLAEKYGFYEVAGKEIFDYHPDSVAVPVGLFQNARQSAPPKGGPAVQVFVKCNTRGQMLGVAEGDLYLLEGERTFDENFFKSAFGLWCRVCLVIGLAVACSTYLAGVISFLTVAFLYLAAFASEHVTDVASGQSFVGGPFRSVNQILRAEQPTAGVDAASPLAQAFEGGDRAFSWLVRRFVNLVPDVDAYDWTSFLSEGFDIPTECLAMNLVVLVGYLLPWFVLGYYLIRSREVAA